MDPQSLIDPSQSPLPAPWWFIQFFKVLGYTLHTVPMNLWYAGIPVAMLLCVKGTQQGRCMVGRLMSQMPIWIAFGINFGIVPLLFVQLAYYKVFYPATILMAWFWLAIVMLLIPAYYGVYAYASGVRSGTDTMAPWKRASGWVSAVLFVIIGFLFANGFSLMTHLERWPQLWQDHSVGGATLGTALNLGDASLWPRWLLMFGLALTTTAVWVLVDAAWFAARESHEYRHWARGFGGKLYLTGAIWFAVAGSWYALLTWSSEVQAAMLFSPLAVLTLITALSPALPLLLIYRASKEEFDRTTALLLGSSQVFVLAVNAISRQVVQNLNLSVGNLNLTEAGFDVQWSPLICFLLVFLLGVGVIAWMLAQLFKSSPEAVN